MTPFDPAKLQCSPIVSASLQLIPQRAQIGLAPDPAVYYAAHQILNECRDTLSEKLPLLKMNQRVHTLQLFFSADPSLDISSWFSAYTTFLHGIPAIRNIDSCGNAFAFRHTASADYQMSFWLPDDQSSQTPSSPIWLSPAETRLEKMIEHFPDSMPEPLLLTHALYTKLPENLQRSYPTCYYVMHICCHGRS